MAGRLFVVATPIGNLEDISPRVQRVLSEVDCVIAEDTRRTKVLLSALHIKASVESLPAFAEQERAPKLLSRLQRGDRLALCSDAGTPAVSDPGAYLVRAAHDAGVVVEVIPGPSAVTSAIAGSGVGGGGGFTFLGFLPRSPRKQRHVVEHALEMEMPLVFFESPLRLARTLETLAPVIGERPVVVARELTKVHETFHRGTADELAGLFRKSPPKGECSVVIGV